MADQTSFENTREKLQTGTGCSMMTRKITEKPKTRLKAKESYHNNKNADVKATNQMTSSTSNKSF